MFRAVKRHLRTDGYLIVKAANIRSAETVTPLAWHIAHMFRPHLAFRAESYLR